MRRIGLISIVLSAVLLTGACSEKNGFDNSQLKEETVCMRVNGENVLVYDPLLCQMCFNSSLHEFRVFTDNMSDYFSLRLPSDPAREGETLKGCTVTYTSVDDTKTLKNLTFKIKKMDGSGLIWLWNPSDKIFVLVRRF